jgi:hypothetical protein
MAETTEASSSNSFITIGNTSQIIAIALALVYFCGFVVVTAYLGSLGIKDYEAFRTQYIISGATMLLIMGLFYYFVGRHIRTLDDDANEVRKVLLDIGAQGKFWDLYAIFFTMIELAFFIVIATFSSTAILFTVKSTPVYSMIIPMVFGFFIIDSTLTSKAKESVGKLFYILIGIYYLASCIAFFYLIDGVELQFLYFILGGTTFLMIFHDRNKIVRNKKAYSIYMVVFVLITFSGIFGRYFYGHARAAIGGGEPEYVQVVIDESNVPKTLQKELNISDSLSTKLVLIAQTDTEIYLGFPLNDETQGYKTIIRIDRKLIKAIISKDVSVIKYLKFNMN